MLQIWWARARANTLATGSSRTDLQHLSGLRPRRSSQHSVTFLLLTGYSCFCTDRSIIRRNKLSLVTTTPQATCQRNGEKILEQKKHHLQQALLDFALRFFRHSFDWLLGELSCHRWEKNAWLEVRSSAMLWSSKITGSSFNRLLRYT